MDTLVREALKLPETFSVDVEEKRLAERVARELRYSPMLDEIHRREEVKTSVKAVEAFKQLGIEPFSEASVEKYKAEMLRKLNWKGATREALDGKIGMWLFFGGGGSAILSAFTLAGVSDWMTKHHQHLLASYWAIPAVCGLAALLTVIIAASGDKKVKEFSWGLSNLSNFMEKVPAFALSRALEVRQAIPNSYFYVDALRSQERYVDPFLVVEVDGKKYYIDVWDEPKFEGRRVK